MTGGAGPTDSDGTDPGDALQPDPDPRHPRQGHPLQRGRRLHRRGLPLRRTDEPRPRHRRSRSRCSRRRSRPPAAASGPGEELGEVYLTVTRDYGAEPVLEPSSDEVDRVRHRDAGARTQRRRSRPATAAASCSRSTASKARQGADGPRDWFFYVERGRVDGRRRRLPAARRRGDLVGLPRLGRGDAGAGRGRLLAAALPRRLRRPAAGRSRSSAAAARRGLRDGARPARGGRGRARRRGDAERRDPGPGRPLGARSRDDPAAAQIEDGPQASGVFADFGGSGRARRLRARRARRSRATRRASFGPGAGLVAATRRYDAPPIWVVTGAGAAGVARGGRGCSTPTTCATTTRSPSTADAAGPAAAAGRPEMRSPFAYTPRPLPAAERPRRAPRSPTSAPSSPSPSSSRTRSCCAAVGVAAVLAGLPRRRPAGGAGGAAHGRRPGAADRRRQRAGRQPRRDRPGAARRLAAAGPGRRHRRGARRRARCSGCGRRS